MTSVVRPNCDPPPSKCDEMAHVLCAARQHRQGDGERLIECRDGSTRRARCNDDDGRWRDVASGERPTCPTYRQGGLVNVAYGKGIVVGDDDDEAMEPFNAYAMVDDDDATCWMPDGGGQPFAVIDLGEEGALVEEVELVVGDGEGRLR